MMEETHTCLSCGGPMILTAKIRRGFAADLYVYRCKLCDQSVSKEVERGALVKPAPDRDAMR